MRLLVIYIFTFILLPNEIIAQKYCSDDHGPAFDGNDLISYYDGKILRGNMEFEYEHDGLTMFFSSQKNLDRFKNDPNKYMPAYGGWCSIAMSLNSLVEPNYNYFKFDSDGQVMFFEVRAFLNGITLWEKDTIVNKVKADNYYEILLEQNK